ncbi:MAG: type I-B CRISPR-associated protein Cas5b [Desulfobacteraceae bacterium]|jgi:CRISPR-associated protein Cas5h
MIKALSFKLRGDYGHFKKYYTTTSPLTFEFPPPPTVVGIVSAIIGLDKSCYLSEFPEDSFKLAVCITKPVKKARWTVNLIDTKKHFWHIQNRTQIRTEYLKDPEYEIFFHHSDSVLYNQLKSNLENHRTVYSVSLGLSELLGDFSYTGEHHLEEVKSQDFQSIRSVVPVSRLLDDRSVRFDDNREIFKVSYPVIMAPDRVVVRRDDVIFERCARSVTSKVDAFHVTEKGENIVFF